MADTHCEICGERFAALEELAEMYDSTKDEQSVICHAACGLDRGYEVA